MGHSPHAQSPAPRTHLAARANGPAQCPRERGRFPTARRREAAIRSRVSRSQMAGPLGRHLAGPAMGRAAADQIATPSDQAFTSGMSKSLTRGGRGREALGENDSPCGKSATAKDSRPLSVSSDLNELIQAPAPKAL